MMYGPNGEGVIRPDWKVIGLTILGGFIVGGVLLLVL
jgi:hypothetical protein